MGWHGWFGVTNPDPKILASQVMADGKGWVKYPLPEAVNINTRMHLNQELVARLIPVLQKFVDTGDID